MTALTFNDFGDLNADIAFRVIDRLKAAGEAARFGASNVSESAYVEVSFWDADGEDVIASVKLRFSGHDDRHGADITFRTDEAAAAIYTWTDAGAPTLFDDDGEPVEFEVIAREGTEDDFRDAGMSSDCVTYSHVTIEAGRHAALIEEAIAFVATRKQGI